jgi:hypothetical protein
MAVPVASKIKKREGKVGLFLIAWDRESVSIVISRETREG